jgi:hypothetical protein
VSLITLPVGFCPNSFSLRQQTTQRAFASPLGGSEQVIDLDNDRWLVSLTLPNRKFADAAQIEAFIAALRGMTNTVAIYHWIRRVPRGTMRGAPTSQAASIGARSLTLNTTAGATLLAGDMIGVNGLLLQVAADAVANGSGVMAAPIVNSLRTAVAGGTAVAWDKPTAPFRLVSNSSVQYIPGYATEVSLDFAEAIG